MYNETILVVDDEKEIRDLINIYLKNEGYTILVAADGFEAIRIINNQKVDLVVLDIMMPKLDGIQTCIKIREDFNFPVIMLSAKNQDMDKILGLSSGADDYLSKPFNPMELIARIKSQLRRYNTYSSASTISNDDVIEIDDLVINKSSHEVMLQDNPIKFTPIEFKILELLARNRGIVFSISKIYESVWNDTSYASDNTVMVHIRKIREKTELDPRNPKYIKTVWGVGYKIDK